MILSTTVFLKMNNRYVKHYINKGYEVKGGQIIEVKIDDLTKKSNILIEVKCDSCGENKKMKYSTYNRYTKNRTEKYYCNKCNDIKRKITNKEKYGVENVFQSETIKEKRNKKMLDKYGNIHALNIPEFKEKMKKTNQEKFGFDFATQNDNIKEKIKNTFLKNYGEITSLLNIEMKNKISNTNLERYGVKNVFELDYIKTDGMLKKYNVKYPLQNEEIKNKMINTVMKKYGVENIMQNDEIKNKMIKTKQKLGLWIIYSDKDDFINYKSHIKSLTNKNKKALFENWDGYDYYDGEYIKDNLKTYYNQKNYPTIDHIMSVKYGFENKIDAEKISAIENLCITKRWINSAKGSSNDF